MKQEYASCASGHSAEQWRIDCCHANSHDVHCHTRFLCKAFHFLEEFSTQLGRPVYLSALSFVNFFQRNSSWTLVQKRLYIKLNVFNCDFR